jgi:hypothetical protein
MVKKKVKKEVKSIFASKLKMPKKYHGDFREDTNKYFWYYKNSELSERNPKKYYQPKTYFTKYEDAVKDAIKHYEKSKKSKNE